MSKALTRQECNNRSKNPSQQVTGLNRLCTSGYGFTVCNLQLYGNNPDSRILTDNKCSDKNKDFRINLYSSTMPQKIYGNSELIYTSEGNGSFWDCYIRHSGIFSEDQDRIALALHNKNSYLSTSLTIYDGNKFGDVNSTYGCTIVKNSDTQIKITNVDQNESYLYFSVTIQVNKGNNTYKPFTFECEIYKN